MFTVPPDENTAELAALIATFMQAALKNGGVNEVVVLAFPPIQREDGKTVSDGTRTIFATATRFKCDCGHPRECRVERIRMYADCLHDLAEADEKGDTSPVEAN